MRDESPNDIGSDDPANNIGLARVIHLDKNGKFINQWFGENWGPGKFASVHGIGVDPTNGNVWIGDRDQYRIVIYTASGQVRENHLDAQSRLRDQFRFPWRALDRERQ